MKLSPNAEKAGYLLFFLYVSNYCFIVQDLLLRKEKKSIKKPKRNCSQSVGAYRPSFLHGLKNDKDLCEISHWRLDSFYVYVQITFSKLRETTFHMYLDNLSKL